LLPPTNAYASQLEYLLRDPEMAALVAAAPASLGRPLRSLCRMLGLTPPPILAPPPRPAKPKPAPAAPKPPKPPPPPDWPGYRVPSAHWPRGVLPRRPKIPA
jgi:hypothetical protein